MTATASTPDKTRLERLGNYLAVDPNNTALLDDYAQEAWKAQEFEACAQAWRKLLELEAPTVERVELLARALFASGDVAHAVSALEEALTRWPQASQLPARLAQYHFAARDFERALAALPDQEESDTPDAPACALRIRLLHHLGQLSDAADAALAFESRFGSDAVVSAAVLPVLTDLSRFAEATQRANALAAPGPPQSAPYEVCEPLAIAALDGGDAAGARQWIDRALLARRDDGRIWLLDGMSRVQAGQWDGAAEALERAVQLMPTHAGSHLAQGWMHLVRDDFAAAKRSFEHGVDASPAFAEGYGSLAVVAARTGQQAEADALIRKALLLDRACASAKFAQALRRGVPPQKIQDLAKAVIARARSTRVTPK
jgi:tetratricopeptide (TPR) repeat protein